MSTQNINRETSTSLQPLGRPLIENNSVQNFNKTFTPLISNSFSHNKSSNFSPNLTQTAINVKKNTPFHPLQFYALGKIPTDKEYPTLQWNKGIKSTSNNIIERNVLSINTKKFNQIYPYKNLASLYQQNVTENNYMKPLKLYRTSEKYNLPTNTTNFETYKIMKEKYFSKDIQSTIAKGKKLNKTDFIKEKENIMKNKDNTKFKKIEEIKVEQNQEGNNKERKSKTCSEFFFKDPNDYTKELMKNNIYNFEQNNIQMIKPKKYKFEGKLNLDNQKVSDSSPKWFNVMPDWKIKQYRDYIGKNEDTINILSKHQNWITTSPLTNDRRHPFEKQKTSNIGTSKIMPKWMELKFKNMKREENLKSTEYYPIRQKCKKQMVFVDKELNPKKIKVIDYDKNKSIFSYGDFRNNVVTKEQHIYYDSKVSQVPKRFLSWDDKTKFNPKFKKDI